MEGRGVYEPIGLNDWIDHYGVSTYNNYRFFTGFKMAFELTNVGPVRANITPKYSPRIIQTQPKMTTDIVPYRVYVKGHFRTLPNGNKVWVKPHFRSLPNRS